MATSTRTSDNNSETANGSAEQAAGNKHQIDEKPSPETKRAKKTAEKEQKTIEETMNGLKGASQSEDKDKKSEEIESPKEFSDTNEDDGQSKVSRQTNGEQGVQNGKDESAEKSNGRHGATPASILEKGIIYFFFRGRIGIDDPSSVNDVARSYIILRPIDKDAKLGEGTVGDAGNSRLIAIPKKVLPLSGNDKWIAFVEKSNASFATLKDEFLSASDYETKTAGTRHSPAATPVGEGIYAITTTGRENHLAYMLTLPSEIGEVQTKIGLRERGSFTLSTRNPAYDAPGNVALPQSAEYPQEVKDEFRSLRWTPTNPKHLDYANTQFLLIGESSGIEQATQPQSEDQQDGKNKPLEELEKLEEEDANRMENLKGDDAAAIYADLEVHAKDYPKLQTTF